jgi:hypothetical protein
MRSIKEIHKAENAPVGDLVTYRVLPTRSLGYLDPFLFLNHHGPQVYPPNNHGLPFGPHPHRGMETVTFIIDGDISHKDNTGHESVIGAGGIQWMRAGKGIIHSETSSAGFLQKGGPMEILQLWINLPAGLKMSEPFYKGFQSDEISKVETDNGKVDIDVIAGELFGGKAAFDPGRGIALSLIRMKQGGRISCEVAEEKEIFFYIIRGQVKVNRKTAAMLDLVEFSHNGKEIVVEAIDESIIMFGYGDPLHEPVVAQGPFVMNTQKEIMKAYHDYRQGKFGSWKE